MKFMSKFMLVTMLLILIIGADAYAQYPFGKNKIQYSPKKWKLIETDHVDIYYYPDEEVVAKFIAVQAESIYAEYSDYFDVEFERKIPVIIYGTHHDFKETNVVPYLISESTGGFTEFVKGRVVLPFMGSYKRLRRIFRHEMTHAFMLEKLRLVMKKHRRFKYPQPPLWFTEGLAEYIANKRLDSEARMFLRDAVTSGNFYPLEDLWRVRGSYLMYKEGEAAVYYIALRFGDLAIRKILENWWKSDRFDFLLRETIGLNVRELSKQWLRYLKRRYYPSLLTMRNPDEIGIDLIDERFVFDIHPATADPSIDSLRTVYCIGYDMGAINLLKLSRIGKGKWKSKVFIRGEKSTRFESFPVLRSRISMRGDTLVFVTKSGERDAVYLYSVSKDGVLKRLSFPELRIISSPSLSHDGKMIVFSGIDNRGKSDLFIYRMDKNELLRLTNDYFEDIHPDWISTDSEVVFSSDRCSDGVKELRAIYSINIASRRIMQLTDGRHDDVYPRYMSDNKGVIFASDRNGTYDIYIIRDGRLYRQTNIIGGAFAPYPIEDGKDFLASVYRDGTFRVFVFPVHFDNLEGDVFPKEFYSYDWRPDSLSSQEIVKNENYRPKFELDFIGAAFALDPDFGYMGNGAQFFLSDILGNHQLIFLFGTATDNFDEIFKNINFAFTYVNLENRLNYAIGAFHLASYFGSYYDILRYERRYGVMGALSYPFSKFTRADLSVVAKGMERDDEITYLGLKEGKSWLVTNYISFTNDNILWYIGGPMNGHRFNVSLGNTIDLEGRGYEYTTLMLDLRHYYSLGKRIILAQRIVSRNAWGSDLQLFYLGGSWDLRGYRFRQYSGKRVTFINTELRFPLVDRLLIRFPFGRLEFPLFRGSLFLDAGRVDGFIYETGWLGSFGAGVEMNLGVLPVMRLNFCRLTDFKEIEKGLKIDLFLGYNF